MGIVYELLIMRLPTISIVNRAFTLDIAEPVETVDKRDTVFGTGITILRPNDVRGDSVNRVFIGGRFDALTEALDEHRAKADRAAVAEQQADILDAQAAHDVPVVGIKLEPVTAV